jgi:hypothetical protein
MRNISRLALVMILMLATMLAGCGGGGTGLTPTAIKVTGVAATGSPMVGTVYLKDSSTPSKELKMTIAADGSYSFEVTGLTKPFLLKAVGTVNGVSTTLYSVSSGPGVTNINPFTNLAALAVAQSATGGSIDDLYVNPTPATLQKMNTAFTLAVTNMMAQLQPLLTKYQVQNIKPATDAYSANHQGLDAFFDANSVAIVSGQVTITNNTSHAPVFVSQVSNLAYQLAYSAIPPQGVVSASSESFQAARINELGSEVQLADNAPKNLASLSVVFASYGCESGDWSNGTCKTTPGTGFTWPITAKIYADNNGSQGELLATATKTFTIPYRPSGSDSRCTDHNQFYNTADQTCHYSLPATLTFDNFSSVALPPKVIWTVTYNTQSAGYSPQGQVCDGNNINVGVGNLAGEPNYGTDLGMGNGMTANDTTVFMSYNDNYTGPPTKLQSAKSWPNSTSPVHRPLGAIWTK